MSDLAQPRTVRLGPGGAPASAAVVKAPEDALQPGAIIGGYELVRAIGKGGTGAVFLARDLKLGRRVAIKFVVSPDATVVRRFLLEAQATARCVHENIVVIHEVGAWQGIPFLVLEYLDGPALSAMLTGTPLPLARTLEIMLPVVRALQCAHQANIVHRDLKPDNIIVTRRGAVKVVDFGIAKAFRRSIEVPSASDSGFFVANASSYETLSGPGLVVGTLPYMAPEQWRGLDVDARCDLFAVGVILFRMLTSRHPSGTFAARALRDAALSALPYPSIATVAPELPEPVVHIVDRCLRKLPDDRYVSADELLADLEALSRSTRRAPTAIEECPYPGLSQFTMHDAPRYFGRGREVTSALAILRRTAVLAVLGPSGSGKSSLALAGVAPSLRSSLGDCEVVTLRPGRAPVRALLDAIGNEVGLSEHRLRVEPGALGVALREACQRRGGSLLLVVDQLEEIFTLAHDAAERRAFVDALLGAADDVSSAIRLVVTLRSDFLHRVAEHPWLTEAVSDGMLLLTPPDRGTLRAALVQPLAQVGYELEDEELTEEILSSLAASTAPLPLLQLVGTRLWSHRDRKRRCLSRHAYREMGGVHGALAGQADAVLAGLSPAGRKVARGMLVRLVTADGTRAVVDRDDLVAASPEASAVLQTLLQARLLVVHDDDATVELIHEALIEQWPSLRAWIQESREDFVLRDRISGAARQWAEAGHPVGLLWTGDVLRDAEALVARDVPLGARERSFIAASVHEVVRCARRRRLAVTSALAVLAVLATVSLVALVAVHNAEKVVRQQAQIAVDEARRAREAERAVSEKVDALERKERERLAAAAAAARSSELVLAKQGEVERSRADLELALAEAQTAQRKAELSERAARELAKKEHAAREALQAALERERERVEALSRQRKKIEQTLQ